MDLDALLAELIDKMPEAVFTRWLTKNVSLTWLEEDDERLGMTRFEEGPHELVRRRRLALAPGKITIGLHPQLTRDEVLLKHTLAHELLHASGLLEHSQEHEQWLKKIAPGPQIEDSPLLQEIREQYLLDTKKKEWICSQCGFKWARKTVSRPLRCPKCAKRL
jgi:hypothetical protein